MTDFLKVFSLVTIVPAGLWVAFTVILTLVSFGLVVGIFSPVGFALKLAKKAEKKRGIFWRITALNLYFVSAPFVLLAAAVLKLLFFVKAFSESGPFHSISNKFECEITFRIPFRLGWIPREEERALSFLTLKRKTSFNFLPPKGLSISFSGLGLNSFGDVSETLLQGKVESTLFNFNDHFFDSARLNKTQPEPQWIIELSSLESKRFETGIDASLWLRELLASGWQTDTAGSRQKDFTNEEWDWLCAEGRAVSVDWLKRGSDVDSFLKAENMKKSA